MSAVYVEENRRIAIGIFRSCGITQYDHIEDCLSYIKLNLLLRGTEITSLNGVSRSAINAAIDYKRLLKSGKRREVFFSDMVNEYGQSSEVLGDRSFNDWDFEIMLNGYLESLDSDYDRDLVIGSICGNTGYREIAKMHNQHTSSAWRRRVQHIKNLKEVFAGVA